MKPTLDELLALDLLTLTEHTERAGDRLDAAEHAARLRVSLAKAHACAVRRDGRLVAYALLDRRDDASGFVLGFCLHPAHRQAPSLRDLLRQVAAWVRSEGIHTLRSHVYKTNHRSIAFHRKLGFIACRENDKAFEFVAGIDTLDRWIAHKQTRSASLS